MRMGHLKSSTAEVTEVSVKSKTIDVDRDYKQWLTFYINNELYAVDAMQVREVLNYSEIVPVPGSPAYITGLINLRGKVVTVINTRVMFSLPSTDPDKSSNIVLIDFNEEEMVGFIVDSVDEVMNILTKSIEDSPKTSELESSKGFVTGVALHDNKMVICLDIKQLISYINPNIN
jgi:purine-binding chemotaxis protein CheW